MSENDNLERVQATLASESLQTTDPTNSVQTTNPTNSVQGQSIPSTKVKKPRHKWNYALQAQVENKDKTELVMDYPFLNDENDQDFLFSKYLLANAPYRSEYSSKGDGWNTFCNFMSNVKDRHGMYPFKNMAQSTAKARYKKYLELCSTTWSDENGDTPAMFLNDDEFRSWDSFEESNYSIDQVDDGTN